MAKTCVDQSELKNVEAQIAYVHFNLINWRQNICPEYGP